jgi:hypothetical protein
MVGDVDHDQAERAVECRSRDRVLDDEEAAAGLVGQVAHQRVRVHEDAVEDDVAGRPVVHLRGCREGVVVLRTRQMVWTPQRTTSSVDTRKYSMLKPATPLTPVFLSCTKMPMGQFWNQLMLLRGMRKLGTHPNRPLNDGSVCAARERDEVLWAGRRRAAGAVTRWIAGSTCLRGWHPRRARSRTPRGELRRSPSCAARCYMMHKETRES